MKITDVDTILLSVPIKKQIKDATFSIGREQVIVRVFTDEGIIGIGEACQFIAISTTREIVEKGLKPLILGEDPFNVEKLWKKMYLQSYLYGREGAAIIALSGIETALWDIIGKVTKLPIYKLLGGCYRNKIKAYATGGFVLSKEELVNEIVGYLEKGFRAVKIKIGFNFKKDIERVKMVRDVIGNDIDLMVDGNISYSPASAILMAKRIEKYDIFWFEEPIPSQDIEGMLKIASAVDIPLAAGENDYTRYGFKELISRRVIDIIQADVARAGGFLECKKIASMADAAGIFCAPHGFGHIVGLAANIHFVASTPNAILLEVDQLPNPLRDELLVTPIEIKRGYVAVLEKPGLGIEINDDAVSKYSVK